MTLNEDLVAARWVVLTFEEVVKANLVERSARSEGRNVSAYTDTRTLCAVNQHRSIPTHPGAVGSFNGFIAREGWFILRSDGVNVVSGWNDWNVQLQLVRAAK